MSMNLSTLSLYSTASLKQERLYESRTLFLHAKLFRDNSNHNKETLRQERYENALLLIQLLLKSKSLLKKLYQYSLDSK